MHTTDIIIAPIISEKSTKDAGIGRFTFKVAKEANKTDIKKAVEEKFKVHVVSVATTIVKGRGQRFGVRRVEVVLPSWKKTIVQIKPGEKIGLFEVSTS